MSTSNSQPESILDPSDMLLTISNVRPDTGDDVLLSISSLKLSSSDEDERKQTVLEVHNGSPINVNSHYGDRSAPNVTISQRTPTRIIPCAELTDDDNYISDEESADSRLKLALHKRRMWKIGTTLTVSFMDCPHVSSAVIAKVKQYANIWSQYANITFDFVNNQSGTIRVGFIRGKGHSCIVGTDCKSKSIDEPTMNLDPEEINENTRDKRFRQVVLHEFGHALGCIHEHSQPHAEIKWNKDYVYNYYYELHKWSPTTVDKNIFKHYSRFNPNIASTKYDELSIMQYEFGSEFLLEGKPMSGGVDLSKEDKSFIAKYYPFTAGLDTGVLQLAKTNLIRIAGGLRRLIGNPFSSDSTMSLPMAPRSLLPGINSLDTKHERIYISCDVDHVDGQGPVINMESSTDEETDRSDCAWIALPTSSVHFRSGRITFDAQTLKFPGPSNPTTRITFDPPYSNDDIPKVSVWIHAIDSEGDSGHDFKVSANNVDRKGFRLECLVGLYSKCRVHQIGVTWFAHSTKRLDTQSGSFGTGDAGSEVLDDSSDFDKSPKVFMAFSELRLGAGDTCVSVKNESITTKEMTWKFDTWGKTVLEYAQATYIVVGSSQ
ncbi:hypothetical protein QCA50_014731 [Cerrena zonata]|uniref:Peptidase metallopeptidase domain-containing protein n=1 Tax=Cerrena zonata TaxID=2478898 RepID=A0AAW0FSW4_9APHY